MSRTPARWAAAHAALVASQVGPAAGLTARSTPRRSGTGRASRDMTLRTAAACPPIWLPSTRRRRVANSGPRNTWFHAELRSAKGENAPGDVTGGVLFGL